jgi:hypothetical protein
MIADVWRLTLLCVAGCAQILGLPEPGHAVDAAMDAVEVPPDALCTDIHEPNDSIAEATLITQTSTMMATELALCPETDRDYFAVDTAASGSLDADITVTAGSAPLLAVQNSSGVTIANGTASPGHVTVTITTVPAGRYYILVSPNGGEARYSLAVTIGQD